MPLTVSDMDNSFQIIDEYVKRGGNAIDTAHIYGPDRHRLIGEYLKARRRNTLIIMDKGCHPYGRNRVTKEDMASDIAESLERMQIDSMEFFVLHRDDPEVPVGAIVEWLNEQKEAGRIQAFGGSNWHHSRIAEANRYAEEHGLQGFSISSVNLALGIPVEPMWAGAYTVDRGGRDWYEETGFPLFSWSSGSGGFFAGVESDNVKRVYYGNEENFKRRERAEELGKRHGLNAAQMAVVWTLNQPMNVYAIVGPKSTQEVRENMTLLDLKLPANEIRYLELGNE